MYPTDSITGRQALSINHPTAASETAPTPADRPGCSDSEATSPVPTTTTQPMTLYQRNAMLVKYQHAKITASPASTPQNAPRPLTRGKKNASTKTPNINVGFGARVTLQVRHWQDLHNDQCDVVRLALSLEMVSHVIDNALTHLLSRSCCEAVESVQQSVVSEILPVRTDRLRNAIAENEQPVVRN